MNKKIAIAIPVILLTLLIPFAVPAHAPSTLFPTTVGSQLQALLNSAGFNPCIWPAFADVWYELIHDWNPSAMMTGPEGTFPEWTGNCGFVPSGGDSTPSGGLSASAVGGSGGGTVIPGTWGNSPVSLAVNPNAASPITLPEFNPSIAADPTDPNNVVEAQFAMNAAGGLTTSPFLFQCSVAVSHDAGQTYTSAIPSPLPLVGGSNIVSFCSRAMVAWDSAGNVYIVYTDYEVSTFASGLTHSLFRMVKSTDKGATWTDLAGNAGASTILNDPLVVGGGGSGTEAGIPIFPVLAVSGSNLDVAYTMFSNQPTDDIRSISSTDAQHFTSPVVIATVNPSTGHFILAPSNAYNGATLYVVWYDDDTIPPPSSAYHVKGAKSSDNGITWTAPSNVFTGDESVGPFHRGVLTWPSEWPHLATEPNSNFAYVVTSEGRALSVIVINPWNQYHIAVIYSSTGDITGATHVQDDFSNRAIVAPFDQLFPAVTTQPDGTVHVTWLDTTPGGPFASGLTGFWSEILYSASNPANLRPTVAVENWANPQWASSSIFRLAFFSGIFFSVTASSSTASIHGFVHTAWAESSDGTIAGLDTMTNSGEKPLLPVGGTVLPTNELALLAPYLLVAVFATLGLAYAMRRRFRGISLPTIPTVNW